MGKEMSFFLKNIVIPGANGRNSHTIRKNFGTGRRYIHVENTPEYLEFKNTIRTVCIRKGFTPILQPKYKNKSNRNVAMSLIVYFKKHGSSDLSGNLKCLEDSLEGYVYENDKQIKFYDEFRIEDFAGFDGIKVTIRQIDEEKNRK